MGMQVIWLYISTLEAKHESVNAASLNSALKTLLDAATSTPDAVSGLLPAAARSIYATWVEVANGAPVSALEYIIATVHTLPQAPLGQPQPVRIEDGEVSLPVMMYRLMVEAIGCGVSDPVAALVEVGADIDLVDVRGSTPLLLAAEYCGTTEAIVSFRRHIDQLILPFIHPAIFGMPKPFSPKRISLVQMLLDAKANASHCEVKGVSALHVAASDGNSDVLSYLLQSKAHVNSADHNGITPLMDAICARAEACAETLVYNGADVNARDKKGQTPLILSALAGLPRMAKMLVSYDADVNVKADDGINALMAAVHVQNAELVSVRIDAGDDVNSLPRAGTTKLPNLHLAAEKGSLVIVRALLSAKANVYGVDFHGRRPLLYAARAGHLDVVQALLDAGACEYIDAEDNNGDTALSLAMANQHTPMVQILVRAGANWRFANEKLKSRVMSAVIKGDHLYLQQLMAAGADLDIVSSAGETPLSQAYKQGDHKAGTALIAGGASLRMPGGKNLLTVAEKRKDTVMVATIKATLQQREMQKKTYETNLLDAVRYRMPVHHIATLLQHKANVDCVDKHGNTPLLLAARYSSQQVVALLLASKANIEVINAQGQSPLTAVVIDMRGGDGVVEQLLSAKADANRKDKQGRTPLMVAVYHGRQAVVQQLLAAKAKVNVSDKGGMTALHLAARNGSSHVMQQLLAAKADVKAGDTGRGVSGNAALPQSVRSGSLDCVRMLLDAKASIGANSRARQTLLQCAVRKEIRELLQQHGAKQA